MKAHMELIHGARNVFYEHDWCKRTYARNKKGDAVDPLAEDACAFCITGAVYKALDKNPHWGGQFEGRLSLTQKERKTVEQATRRIYDELLGMEQIKSVGHNTYGCQVVVWNDERCIDKIEVTNLLDSIIEKEEK